MGNSKRAKVPSFPKGKLGRVHSGDVNTQINVTYSRQLSTAYLFGKTSLRLTREQIENHLCIYYYQVLNGLFKSVPTMTKLQSSQMLTAMQLYLTIFTKIMLQKEHNNVNFNSIFSLI